MFCISYIKAGIFFALEEHRTVNIVCNSLSFNFSDMIIELLFQFSLSCYNYDLLIQSCMVRHKFLSSMQVQYATCPVSVFPCPASPTFELCFDGELKWSCLNCGRWCGHWYVGEVIPGECISNALYENECTWTLSLDWDWVQVWEQ